MKYKVLEKAFFDNSIRMPGDIIETDNKKMGKAFEPVDGQKPSVQDDPKSVYGKLKKDELVNLCNDRGIPADGNKEDLVARLEEADGSKK